jgi:hypothetical protein
LPGHFLPGLRADHPSPGIDSSESWNRTTCESLAQLVCFSNVIIITCSFEPCKYRLPTICRTGPFCSSPCSFCHGRRQALLHALKDHLNPEQPTNWTPEGFFFSCRHQVQLSFISAFCCWMCWLDWKRNTFDTGHAKRGSSTRPRNWTRPLSSMDFMNQHGRPAWELTHPT